MRFFNTVLSAVALAGMLALPITASADDAGAAKPKPYTLSTCIVSGDKLGGDMGKPYVYIYKNKKVKGDPGHEIKFCCKSCLKKFHSNTAEYLRKIDEKEREMAKGTDGGESK